MNLHQVLHTPLQTEKSALLSKEKKYVVIVHPAATKIDVRQAVEKAYHVKVAKVHMLRNPAKERAVGRGRAIQKRPDLKKAIITLEKGEKGLDFIKAKKK